jgi:hypothetical protein
LSCLAATFLVYDQPVLFNRVVAALTEIYNLAMGPQAHALDFATQIDPAAKAPRFWLLVMRRVFGLGALAVRLRRWDAVRALTLHAPAAKRLAGCTRAPALGWSTTTGRRLTRSSLPCADPRPAVWATCDHVPAWPGWHC